MKSKSNRKYFIQKVPISMCISFFVCKSCDIIKKKFFFKMLTSFEITCRSINTSLFVIHAQWKYLHKCLEGQNSKPTSYTEYLRAMRDYKRRRQSYRAKNVHITRKSYTEVTWLISRFCLICRVLSPGNLKFWTQERQKVTIGIFRQITH